MISCINPYALKGGYHYESKKFLSAILSAVVLTATASGLSSLQVSLTGFPGELNNNNTGSNTMYTGTGNVSNGTNMRLYYTADSTGGNSGGPVYITETRLDKTYYTVIGINVSGISQNGVPLYNSAIRINTDLLHFYCNNPNLSWE